MNIYIFSNKARTQQPNIKFEAVNKFFNKFFFVAFSRPGAQCKVDHSLAVAC